MNESDSCVLAEGIAASPSLSAIFLDEQGREIREIEVYRGRRQHDLGDMQVILREALLAQAASILLLRRPAPRPNQITSAEVTALLQLSAAAGTAGISPVTYLCEAAGGRRIEMVLGSRRDARPNRMPR